MDSSYDKALAAHDRRVRAWRKALTPQMRELLDEFVAFVEDIDDPVERLTAVALSDDLLKETLSTMSDVRIEAVQQLAATGVRASATKATSVDELGLADLMGVSKQRAALLIRGGKGA